MDFKVIIDHKFVLAAGLAIAVVKLSHKVSLEAAKEVLDKFINYFKGNLID